jgi:serine protease AprX
MSGISKAAAVTSGVVALMLPANPSLTPDVVKCGLLASASPAITGSGILAYSVCSNRGPHGRLQCHQQHSYEVRNQSLELAADLARSQHWRTGQPSANGNSAVVGTTSSGSAWATRAPN